MLIIIINNEVFNLLIVFKFFNFDYKEKEYLYEDLFILIEVYGY